jgi:hypothetical protein
MFSGLKGEDINTRYLKFLKSRILEPIAIEIRAELGLPTPEELPLKIAEVELAWGINSRIFYLGQRKWIFNMPLEMDIDTIIEYTIITYLSGARTVVPMLIKQD